MLRSYAVNTGSNTNTTLPHVVCYATYKVILVPPPPCTCMGAHLTCMNSRQYTRKKRVNECLNDRSGVKRVFILMREYLVSYEGVFKNESEMNHESEI
jgi:hypothetical protein